MEIKDKNFEKLIKESGLKNPSDDFTSNILNNLPEEICSESIFQIWMDRLSFLIPAVVVIAGLSFVFITVPLPEFSVPSFLFSFNFTDIADSLFTNFTSLINNIYILAGIALLGLFFFIELVYNKIRSMNFLI